MKSYRVFLVVLYLSISTFAQSDSNNYVRLTGIEGSGKTEESAIRAALLSAVRYVTGEYIQARQELINKKSYLEILSLANGSISSFEIIERKFVNSTHSVIVDCIVERSGVSIFADLDPKVYNLDYKSRWAQIVTKIDNKRDALKILNDTIPRLAPRLLSARFISNSIDDDSDDMPVPEIKPDLSSNRSKLYYYIKIMPNAEYWNSSVAPVFSRCFTALADNFETDSVHFSKLSIGSVNSSYIYIPKDEDGIGFSPHSMRKSKMVKGKKIAVANQFLRLEYGGDPLSSDSQIETFTMGSEEVNAINKAFNILSGIVVKLSLIDNSGNSIDQFVIKTPPPFIAYPSHYIESSSRSSSKNIHAHPKYSKRGESGLYFGPRLNVSYAEYISSTYSKPLVFLEGKPLGFKTYAGSVVLSLQQNTPTVSGGRFTNYPQAFSAGFLDSKLYRVEFDIENSKISEIAGLRINFSNLNHSPSKR